MSKLKLFLHPWLWLSMLFSLAGPASAAMASPWVENENSRFRLIALDEASEGGSEKIFGLQFELEPGWKVYWRSPGAAGTPPDLKLSDDRGPLDSELLYPVPQRFDAFGLSTFGYKDAVTYPFKAAPRTNEIQASLTYLICSDICIPEQGEIALSLSGPENTFAGGALRVALAGVPGFGAEAGLELVSHRFEKEGERVKIKAVASAAADWPFETPDLAMDGPEGWSFSSPTVNLNAERTRAEFSLVAEKLYESAGPLAATNSGFLIFDGSRGLFTAPEIDPVAIVSASGERAKTAPTFSLYGLLSMLVLALLGGLILNVMPCVLPVLSLKLLKLVEADASRKKAVRRSTYVIALGILLAFLGLAIFALALKAAGRAAGWGVQFQSPVFVLFMVWVMTLFAANLFGWWRFTLPEFFTRTAGKARGDSFTGSLATGFFATLLATPCTAPFLGTALSFALLQPAHVILLFFLVIGLGMALPYILVGTFPRTLRLLPKPGPWMNKVKILLGLLLLGTAVWLLWILQSISSLVFAGTMLALLILFFLSLLGLRQLNQARWQAFAIVGTGALFLALGPMAPKPPANLSSLNIAAIDRWVDEGQVVLVEVTAEWCLTCKVNRALVIDREPVKSLLQEDGRRLLTLDWTNPDPNIEELLESFGRAGIPFAAVYGPRAREGMALPVTLSTKAVVSALELASRIN